MSPKFSVSNILKQNSNIKNQNMEENNDDSTSDVNPFDDDEFSELGGSNEDDDIEEALECEIGRCTTKRKISEVPDENDHETERKKKKLSISRKAPTAEEMIKLRETENLFHSNLFRMQIEELLIEVKPKMKDKKAVRIWLEKFISYLSNIPDDSCVCPLDDHELLNDKKVQYPLPTLPLDPKGKFQFIKPSSVKCFGSFNNDCCLGPNYSVDIVIIMPKDCFHQKDYLNARYHKKRALYLCRIAKYLSSSTALDPDSPTHFCVTPGNTLKPILLVKPSAQWSSKVKVYIHAISEFDTFKLSRFSPVKNNIRQEWWGGDGHNEDENLISTPHYNASIGQDLVLEVNEKFCCDVLNENPNLRDALLLLKVWLCQRELYENFGGISGFLLSALLVTLFKQRKLNAHMSSYQVLRNTWLMLSQTDWLTGGPCLSEGECDGMLLEEFHSNYEVVFIDVTGFVNIASNVTKTNYIRLKEEAKLAMKYLDNPCLNSFQALFTTRLPFMHQFDHIISIKVKKVVQLWEKIFKNGKKELDLLTDKLKLFVSTAYDLLERGLGQRVSQIAVQLIPPSTWSVVEKPPTILWNTVIFGLKLNPESALSVIEKGPEANLSEGMEFRKFWNPKSELRRFQDGSVCEAVVWDLSDAPFSRRRVITQKIVEFLFTSKLQLPKGSFNYLSNQLEWFIKDKLVPETVGSVEELSLNIIKSLDDLIKNIRDLTLPLPVTSVTGISPALRFTDVFPPTAYEGYSKCISENGQLIINEVVKKSVISGESVEAVIQLGWSAKWPENVDAIKRIRAAFIIEIGKELSEKYNLKTHPFPSYLKVFKDGYSFKLRVIYLREISLMKEIMTSEGLAAYRDTPESLHMEKYLLHLPKLNGLLHGLSQQFPGYGPTVCLVKRWIRSQMLDDELFPDIAIELIVAWQFVSPEPFTVPLQPQAAFLRVLNSLCNTNWCLEPIIINFNGDLTSDDITEIDRTFRSGRENKSLPGLFIATSCDKTGIVWTRDAPTLPILYHTAKLAKAALALLETELLMTSNLSRLKTIFRPPLNFYDVLIHLHFSKNPRHTQAIDWKEKDGKFSLKPKSVPKHIEPVVDFNPVLDYLQELRENYGEFALFFHDTYGGNVIGVLFQPSVNEVKDFKVSHLNGRKPLLEGREPKLIFNKDAVIEDFRHIGKNLVISIERKTLKHDT